MTFNKILLIIYVAYLVIMSIVSLVLYGKDKKLAVKGAMRVKEKTLLSVAVFGGAVGSEIGRKINHHKTNKIYFSMTIYLSILLEAIALGILIWLAI